MRKIVFILMLSLFPSSLAFSQEKIDVIYLKNGSIIKGEIVEIKPNQHMIIETWNGSSIICKYNEIDKITRETTEIKTNAKKDKYVSERKLLLKKKKYIKTTSSLQVMIPSTKNTMHGVV